MISKDLRDLEPILEAKIFSATSVAGGCVSNAQCLTTSVGKFFCKLSADVTSIFREEAAGLEALRATGMIRIPNVIAVSDHHLVLEWIPPSAPKVNFFANFGSQLARMHKIPQTHFGFTADNHIGPTAQLNPRVPCSEISWADYFIEYRLKPLCTRLDLKDDLDRARPAIHSALDCVQEPPSLVHGDLWSGNFLCDNENQPVLIDPAVYWGHREVDLAMTELFGGFPPEFYQSYGAEYPLQPGYELRKSIYNLYHLLNHWLLFGDSYRTQAMQVFAHLKAREIEPPLG